MQQVKLKSGSKFLDLKNKQEIDVKKSRFKRRSYCWRTKSSSINFCNKSRERKNMDSKVNCLQVAKDKIFIQLATDATAKNYQL